MALRWTFHWVARIGGALVGSAVLGVMLSRAMGPEGATVPFASQSPAELTILATIAISAIALLVGWHHEMSGGIAATAGGIILLAAAEISQEMHPLWALGAAFLIPGAFYLLAAKWPHKHLS